MPAVAPAETQARRDQWEERARIVAERNKKIQKALTEGYGITMQDIFNGEAVVRLRGSEMVKRVMKRNFTPEQRKALRMMIDGYGDRAISRTTGLHRTDDLPKLEKKFRRLMKARFRKLAEQGLTLDDFAREGDRLFEPVEVEEADDLSATGDISAIEDLSEEEIMGRVDAMMDALFVNTKARNSGRVKKIDSAGSGKKGKGGKRRPKKRFDADKPEHVAQVGRIIPAEVGTNGFDIAMEAWIMNILSGPQTQMVNITGNAFNIGFEYAIQKWLEGAWNLVLGRKEGAQLGEYGAMTKALAPFQKRLPSLWANAWQQATLAWNTEISFFEADNLNDPAEIVSARGKMEQRRPAIKDQISPFGMKIGTPGGRSLPGALYGAMKGEGWSGVSVGKTVRIPGRGLLFFDVFFKALVGQIEVVAQAYRIGKALGKTGAALDNFIAEQMVPGSEAWHGAVQKAKELTFTNELRHFRDGGGMAETLAKVLLDARTKKGVVHPAMAFILGILFPFIQTPFRIFQAGLRRTPLGLAGIAMFHTQGLVRLSKGKTYFGSESEARLARDLADQTIAWTTFAIMMAFSEGDDDDDEKPLLITGSHPWKVEQGGERESARRLNGGPMMIRFGTRENGVWMDYGRIEPLAVTLGSVVDVVRSVKRARKGSPLSEESGRLLHYIASQTTEKTFLRGFADLMKFWERPDISGDTVPKVLAGALVPNLIRQPIRNLDQYARDYRTAPWYYHALPLASFAEKKIDVLGEPIPKANTPIVHLLKGTAAEPAARYVDPWLKLLWDVGYSHREDVHPLDAATRNWAINNPEMAETYFPSRNYVDTFTGADGEKYEMLPAEKALVDRLGGGAYSQRLMEELSQLDQDSPTEEVIDEIQGLRRGSFSGARDTLFQGGERPYISPKPLRIRDAFFGREEPE